MSKPIGKTLALVLAGTLTAPPILACESDYEALIGSVCIVASSYCPDGYAEANGQLLNIVDNQALFSLLGCTYGGNCTTTFALPDLRSRAPVHVGQGAAGLSRIDLGQMGGSETVTLTPSQLPSTTTSVSSTDVVIGTAQDPHGTKDGGGSSVTASHVSVALNGGNQPVPVRDPYLGLRYCVALRGVYPIRP